MYKNGGILSHDWRTGIEVAPNDGESIGRNGESVKSSVSVVNSEGTQITQADNTEMDEKAKSGQIAHIAFFMYAVEEN